MKLVGSIGKIVMTQLELIKPEPQHIPELARICFEAFKVVHERHGLLPDIATIDVATHFMEMLVTRGDFYGVVARVDGNLVGSNFISFTDPVSSVGPVTVDPSHDGRGIGRAMMNDVLARAKQKGVQQIRLLQDAFNTKSLSLYASVGFDTQAPVGLMMAKAATVSDPTIRAASETDLSALDGLCRQIYKVSRQGELTAALKFGSPIFLREREQRITGYLIPGFLGHGIAEKEADALALIGEAARQVPQEHASFFCPLTSGEFFRAALKAGCRLRKVVNYMTLGPFPKPEGIWMPSIGY